MTDRDFAGLALVLLAAGRGTRFGGGKLGAKLSAMLGGHPVALHAATTLGALPFAHRLAIVSTDTPPLPGFTALPLDPPGAPQSRSLAIGVAAAREAGARAIMVALADMPLVPPTHARALAAAFDGDRIASRADGALLPPAIFGAAHFPALLALGGDRGAGALLRGAPALDLPPDCAIDIDRPEDLTRAEALLARAAPADFACGKGPAA